MNENDDIFNIEIVGLTEDQRKILDKIWSADSREDIDEIYSELPEEQKHDFVVLLHMVKMAIIDQSVETSEDCAEAMELFYDALDPES